MGERIILRDLSAREGFQILKHVVPTTDKLRLIKALTVAAVPEIEVTAFVRADKVPQLADSEQLVSLLGHPPSGVKYRALGLNPRGFTRALQFKNLTNDAWFYSGASDTFLSKNANTTFAKQLKDFATEWGTLWRANGLNEVRVMLSSAFGCAYEGVFGAEKIAARWQAIQETLAVNSFKCVELSLADTVGYATAETTADWIKKLRLVGAPEISLHLHDTRSNALQCVEAALDLGVRIFEGSVAGLGGCPFTAGAAGNVATEALVALLHKRGFQTGIDVNGLAAAVQIAQGFK